MTYVSGSGIGVEQEGDVCVRDRVMRITNYPSMRVDIESPLQHPAGIHRAGIEKSVEVGCHRTAPCVAG